MKRLLLAAAVTISMASPSFAWGIRSYVIHNNTDPMTIHSVLFRIKGVPPTKFTVDTPATWYSIFGPIPEVGSCLRHVDVDLVSPVFGETIVTAPIKMDVCTQGSIYVSGEWPGTVGSGGIVITFGP